MANTIHIRLDEETKALLDKFCGKQKIRSATVCFAVKRFLKEGGDTLGEERFKRMLTYKAKEHRERR